MFMQESEKVKELLARFREWLTGKNYNELTRESVVSGAVELASFNTDESFHIALEKEIDYFKNSKTLKLNLK